MLHNCDWCGLRYDLDSDSELVHLENCDSFQNQPIVEYKNGKPFVQLPGYPHIFVEKYPLRNEN